MRESIVNEGKDELRRHLTVKEAANQLRLSSTTVYGLCQQKQLRHERLGLGRGKILIPEDAIEEYRQRQTIQTQTDGIPKNAARPKRVFRHIQI